MSSASESIRSLAVRGARAIGRAAALAFAIGFFVVLPVCGFMIRDWAMLSLWVFIVFFAWLAHAAAPRRFSYR